MEGEEQFCRFKVQPDEGILVIVVPHVKSLMYECGADMGQPEAGCVESMHHELRAISGTHTSSKPLAFVINRSEMAQSRR